MNNWYAHRYVGRKNWFTWRCLIDIHSQTSLFHEEGKFWRVERLLSSFEPSILFSLIYILSIKSFVLELGSLNKPFLEKQHKEEHRKHWKCHMVTTSTTSLPKQMILVKVSISNNTTWSRVFFWIEEEAKTIISKK